ncbi:MAG: M23 family metallopeptidase [Oligoflexia bacterium]|nr:M23 family metallopeptidase [Oligoflexia bacterium]
MRAVFCGAVLALTAWSCTTAEKPAATGDAVSEPRKVAAMEIRAEGTGLTLALSAQEVVDGAVVLVAVDGVPPGGGSPRGQFGEVEFPFYPVPARGPRAFEAVLGIPPGHATGVAQVIVRHGGAELTAPLLIKDAQYPAENLKVDPRKVNPRKKDMIRIVREQKIVREVYEAVLAEKLWDGPFDYPVKSAITSIYGTRRLFNGEPRSFHAGLDLRAMVGTPVYAPAGGVVAFVGDLFFTGRTIIMDHGYGVKTVYAHMDKIAVKKGQRLARGHAIGLSGATGRVSGPHLHWMAIVHKTKVNPMDFIKVLR